MARLSSHALVHRALRPTPAPPTHDSSDMNLIFAAPQQRAASSSGLHA